jgi:hypothetical protein
MAHFAQVDENGIVIQVIVAEQAFIDHLVEIEAAAEAATVSEDTPVEEVTEKPQYKKQWIQTSYNTKHGVNSRGTAPLRANYATIGCIYDRENDVFYPPVPDDLPGAVISGAPEWKWTFPVPKPNDGKAYTWDEENGCWVLKVEKYPVRLVITPDDDSYDINSPTFAVYDAIGKKLIDFCERQPELNSEELAGQGRPTFRPFGIANDDYFIYIASNNKLGRFVKNTYKFVDLIDIPLFVNTHEIVVHNSVLYAANTANDTIGIYDLNTKENKFFNVNTFQVLPEAPAPDSATSSDTAHVNSLCVADGKLYFCLHHLDQRDSQLGCFDIKSFKGQIIADAGRCAHGVQVLNGKLYSLSTGTGEVIEVDLMTKVVTLHKVVDHAKTFLRGLDVLDGNIIFGGSNTYSEDNTIYMDNCFVAVFDVKTKKPETLISFKDTHIISDMKIIR